MTDADLPLGRPARVGIIGLGQVYELTVLGYRNNPDAEIVALCDRDAERLAARGAEWPAAARHVDYEAFLRLAMYNRFHYLDEVLTNRRKHENNLSSRYDVLSRTRNGVLSLYRDLYPSDDMRKGFARRLNSMFLVAAYYRRDFKAFPEILSYARAHGASRTGTLMEP